MEDLLLQACRESGRVPKLVLAGHAHNYQRYTTTFLGKPCTFVVVGSGGHAKDKLPQHGNPPIDIRHSYPVRLEYATDKDVGFLRITATQGSLECEFVAVGHATSPDRRFTL